MFVKDQKVQWCAKSSKTYDVEEGGIYEFIGYSDLQWVSIYNDNDNVVVLNETGFKTIIQSIDDIVVGMELTTRLGKGIVKNIINCEFAPIRVKVKEGLARFNIEDFEEYKPKEEIMQEYELTKPFTILDIWNAFEKEHSCNEFQSEFWELMREQQYENFIGAPWDKFFLVQRSEVLMRNLHHLEKKGLIKKIEKDVILEPGMRLRYHGTIYKIADCSNNPSKWRFMLYMPEINFIYSYGEIFTCGTLKELNKFTERKFEVVEDDS